MTDEGLVDRLRGLLVHDDVDRECLRTAIQKTDRRAACKWAGHPAGREAILPGDSRQSSPRSFEGAPGDGLHLYRIEVNFTSELFENGYDPAVLLKNLRVSLGALHPNGLSPVGTDTWSSSSPSVSISIPSSTLQPRKMHPRSGRWPLTRDSSL